MAARSERSKVGRAAADAVEKTAASAVFLDPSGRRWQLLSWIAVPLLLLLVVGCGWIVVEAYQAPARARSPQNAVAWDPRLGDDIEDLPVIGEGPLLRIVRLTGSGSAQNPTTGERIELSTAEIQAAGNADLVIQRYGYAPDVTRTISLTFDDGPHPIYTPRLLDVLSAEGVHATFFVMGSMAAKYPEIVERIVREGHSIGNHTLTHADLNTAAPLRARTELLLTDRIVRSISGADPSWFRLPYVGDDDAGARRNTVAILRAQRLGYEVTGLDFDTADWRYANSGGGAADVARMPLPVLDGRNLTVLMHDAGADDREATIEYVRSRLIPAARSAGYTFTTMGQANPGLRTDNSPATFVDHVVRHAAVVVFVWPDVLIHALFALAIVMVAVTSMFNVSLALVRRRRQNSRTPVAPSLAVSVIIAAYNEEKVITRTLESLLRSTYPFLELLVVDDGSVDGTASAVERVAQHDRRIRLISQPNGGKWAALNNAIAQARGEILVTLDADTLFTPDTVANLVREFACDGSGHRLGAVAGVVRVGNRRRNMLTRWQSLEYLTQIGIERSAHAQLKAVPIVPGACAAWRKSAVVDVGGYSPSTLAEDCDLTLSLHRAGWQVTQADDACAYTEAPDHVDALLAQRIRWTYGTVQAIFKHRTMLLRPRYGWLGMVVLPHMALSVLIPIVFLPFIAVMGVMAVRSSGWDSVGGYFLLFMMIHVVVAAVAVRLMGEPWEHLLVIPVYRIVYEPLRAYLLYTSTYLAIRGVKLGWNKLQRTGDIDVTAALRSTSDQPKLPTQARAVLEEAK